MLSGRDKRKELVDRGEVSPWQEKVAELRRDGVATPWFDYLQM